MKICFLLWFGWCAFLAAQTQAATQQLSLVRGWNAVWLEVQPDDNAPASVFAGAPVASVWTYNSSAGRVDFIQEPSEAAFNRAGWLAFFPPGSPESILSTLFAVHANRAFLIKATNNAVLTVSGKPVLRPVTWQPDAFTLRGFGLSASAPPSFNAFFNPSLAHSNQPIYRLVSNQWQRVTGAEAMRDGEAYWIFCVGGSQYPGPSGVELVGAEIDFGRSLNSVVFRLRNYTAGSLPMQVRDLAPSSPLSFLNVNVPGFAWQPLSPAFTLLPEAGSETRLNLAIRRPDMTGVTYESLLEITDSLGSRRLIAVRARRDHPGTANATSSGEAKAGTAADFAGLWIGNVTVTNVSEAQKNSTNPTPTSAAFDFPLLLHVDSNGVTRLLKEIIQMWQDGTRTNNAQGDLVDAVPGRHVLLTRDELLSQFKGVSQRGGRGVGRRVSSAAYDFDGGTNNFLVVSNGTFLLGDSLQWQLVLGVDAATNPFKHKYHPDHDNRESGTGLFKEEAPEIRRHVRIEFAATDPNSSSNSVSALNYGFDTVAGRYAETVTGLHRNPIHASGSFQLVRASLTPVLNQ